METWLNWLGLARKAGALAPGTHQAEMAIKDGRARVLIIAADAGAAVYRKYHLWAQNYAVPVVQAGTKSDLGRAIGMGPHAILAISDPKLAERVLAAVQPQQGGMEFGGKGKRQDPGVRVSQRAQARQQTADRPVASAESRKHQEPHEHGGARGRTDRSRHHAGQTAAGAETRGSDQQPDGRSDAHKPRSGRKGGQARGTRGPAGSLAPGRSKSAPGRSKSASSRNKSASSRRTSR